MTELLFTAIDLRGKKCVFIGAGAVALRKAKRLLDCGADITIIAPDAIDGLVALASAKKLKLLKRRYETGDITRAFLTIIATDDHDVNTRVLAEAEQLGILVNAAFSKDHGNTFFCMSKRIDDVTVSVMTDEKSPKKSSEILNTLLNASLTRRDAQG